MGLLISKLIPPYHLAWCSLNKAVSLSLKHRRPSSVTDVSQVCCADGFRFASHLGTLRFRSSDCLRFNSWCQFFFTFFKTFQTLALGVSTSGYGYLLPLQQCFQQAHCILLLRKCHITRGGRIRFQIWRSTGGSVATALLKKSVKFQFNTKSENHINKHVGGLIAMYWQQIYSWKKLEVSIYKLRAIKISPCM